MDSKTALIGMSGGVDSSVAALLMQQQGFSCMGVYMRLHSVPCGGANHSADAAAVAQKMGIPFQVMDRALLQGLGLYPNQAVEQTLAMAKAVKEVGGVFVTIFHNETQSGVNEWKGWEGVLKQIVERVSDWEV